MEITCLQMDVLISFYIDGDLSESLKEKVEAHLKECPTCRAKLNIIKSLFSDMNKVVNNNKEEVFSTTSHNSEQYTLFKNNLSAYVDNELPHEESIQMKKFGITNKYARRDLENAFYIRKLMKDSFRKTKNDTKPDFSGKILKQLNLEEKSSLKFNPLIKVGFAFVMTVLVLTAIILFSLML